MKWFLPFLGFICVAELVAKYQVLILDEHLIKIHYVIGIIESIFYGYVFYRLSNSHFLKKIIFFFVPISVVSYLVTYFFYKNIFSYFITNIIISGFFLAVIALLYLYMKFADDDETLLISEPGFWIALGVSLFYSGISISLSLYDFIILNDLQLFGVRLYNFASRVLSVILYSCISISIILCKKKNKISL